MKEKIGFINLKRVAISTRITMEPIFAKYKDLDLLLLEVSDISEIRL